MKKYSIKMRASNEADGKKNHISGAEKIITEGELEDYCAALLKRALYHSKGKPDFINIKIEEIDEGDIMYLPALRVTKLETRDEKEGMQVVASHLRQLGIDRVDEILKIWEQSYAMRGAILLDADTMERLEPDRERGIRATYMDMWTDPGDGEETDAGAGQSGADTDVKVMPKRSVEEKNHFSEALVLATKVVNHPNILAELCISDDPDYVTGYLASKETGYVRITKLKPYGSPNGGRVFLFRGSEAEREDCIRYLEKQKVLVIPNTEEVKHG